MKQEQSSYAGFINGYIAGNLEAHSTELNVHTTKIIDLLRDLEAEVKQGGFKNQELLLPDIQKIISENSDANLQLKYTKLGQNLAGLVSRIADDNGRDIPSYSNFTLKKIIYHFLNIAKTAKLGDIEAIGISIAEKYKSVWKN